MSLGKVGPRKPGEEQLKMKSPRLDTRTMSTDNSREITEDEIGCTHHPTTGVFEQARLEEPRLLTKTGARR